VGEKVAHLKVTKGSCREKKRKVGQQHRRHGNGRGKKGGITNKVGDDRGGTKKRGGDNVSTMVGTVGDEMGTRIQD